MTAAQVLGERREIRAVEPLTALVHDADPYLAAQALQSLVLIVGADELRNRLEGLTRTRISCRQQRGSASARGESMRSTRVGGAGADAQSPRRIRIRAPTP